MKNVKISLNTAAITLAGLVATLPARAWAGATCAGGGSIQDGAACNMNNNNLTVSGGVTSAINTLLYVLGAAAVIVLIVAGFRYVFSGGDPKNTAAAKDTILYAVIGIVVALLSYAIVNFTLGQFVK